MKSINYSECCDLDGRPLQMSCESRAEGLRRSKWCLRRSFELSPRSDHTQVSLLAHTKPPAGVSLTGSAYGLTCIHKRSVLFRQYTLCLSHRDFLLDIRYFIITIALKCLFVICCFWDTLEVLNRKVSSGCPDSDVRSGVKSGSPDGQWGDTVAEQAGQWEARVGLQSSRGRHLEWSPRSRCQQHQSQG